ncbi:MAG: HAD family hydrolase [Vicinamibacterales bacterium]
MIPRMARPAMRRDTRPACIVFDFDGVLVDSNAVKRNAYYEALADIPGSSDAIDEILDGPRLEPADRYHTIARIVSRLGDRAGHADDRPRLTAERVDRYSSICALGLRRCAELPGASELLARLSESHPLYVNSATPEPILRATVAERGWTPYFRDILGSPTTKAANLQRIAAAEGIDIRTMLFVGDSEVDRLAAEQTGCPFVGIVIEEGRFEQPVERVIAGLSRLPSLLAAL